jgi:superfamily II DNA or RNA helicase
VRKSGTEGRAMIKPTIHVWHEGNLLKLGHYLGESTPPAPPGEDLIGLMADHMEYSHVEFLRGREQFYAGDGVRRKVRTVRKQLWRSDPADGLFVCGAGYLDWVVEKIGNLGYDVRYTRVMPRRPRPDWKEFDIERALTRYKFRPGQEECFTAIIGRILAELGGVVDAAAGFGKSDLIAPVALSLPNARIAVGVRRLDVVGKTVSQLRDYLPSVGQVDGQHKESGHRITVYSMDSFEHFDGDADVIFFDEAHELVTPKYAAAIARRLDQAIPIAMTATADCRADGADARMESLFGPTIYYLPYARAEELGLVVPIRVIVHPVEMARNPVADIEDDVARKRHGIWRNKARNRVIADVVNRFPEDMQTLILVATVEHLANLRYYLPHFEAVWAESSNETAEDFARHGLWPDFAKMTLKRRIRLHDDFKRGTIRKAISTIWDQGVSFDGLQVLFWAKGGSSAVAATQGPSRVSRIDRATGKAYGEVHELDDRFDSYLHNQFLTRVRLYKKNGWTIVSEEEPATR